MMLLECGVMLYGVQPLLGALVALGFSDVMHFICSAGHAI